MTIDTMTAVLLCIIAIQFLVIALLAWKNAGAIPPEIVQALFGMAERRSAETTATWDDDVIADLRALYEKLSQDENPTQA